MKKLTKKENEIMDLFWKHGPMFVRELRELYPEPRPHVNTLSTLVRILESNGYLSHKPFGTSYQYFPLISKEEYGRRSLSGVVSSRAVSTLVQEEKISVDELKQLIEQIESAHKC